MKRCCCHPYEEPCVPDAEPHIHRCWPRAMDWGHCGPDDFPKDFCCGGVDEPE